MSLAGGDWVLGVAITNAVWYVECMTMNEILEFADVRGYNPDRRASNLWYLQVEDIHGHTYKGFGLHVMRDQEVPYLVLYHDRGRMSFHVDEVADAGWFHIREWTHVAERVA